jgi:hypothetical protein
MNCSHDGYHALRSEYDRTRAVLVYVWVCESCGSRLRVATRQPYRPHYDPHGNDRFFAAIPRY